MKPRNQILIRVLCGVLLTALAIQLQARAQTNDNKLSQESLDKKLCKAARNGNTEELERLLGQGARVDAVCSHRFMPLGYHTDWPRSKAPWTGVRYNPELVEALLIAGASPDQEDALLDAAYDIDRKPGAREVFQLLLDYGADVSRPYNEYPSYTAYIEKQYPVAAAAVRSAAKIPPEVRKARMLRRHARDVALASLAGKLPEIEEKEKSGDESKNAGKLSEALDHYLVALKDTPPGTGKDRQLREKVIKAALAIRPLPAVPEEAKRHADRAQAFLKQAQGLDGYQRVASELERALILAPWWAGPYFNLGLMREKLGDPAAAIESLKLYQLAAPNAQDAEEVRKKLIELEVAQELANEK